jgi:UDP-N-acetylglucosamine--N-acetylmuramyl-(pentapeptide) pyrophosphoryl-undecaprenol N-acetylglucosamine transferase
MATFVMTGGGTGGHVIPAIAVARQLQSRGHECVFIGTARGLENRLVPEAGFPLEHIDIGGLKGLGLVRRLKTLYQLPASIRSAWSILGRLKPAAVFSMGGYVAGPVVVAAVLRDVPIVAMEPNAVPGATNRYAGRLLRRALVSFEETLRCFPPGRAEITGVPVRPEFFALPRTEPAGTTTILVTGGSQGSQTLNRAVAESLPFFAGAPFPVRLIHQTGPRDRDEIARKFGESGVHGDVTAFIADMPSAFAQADLVVCRAGAGAVAELAASGKPSILVPFPFATDNHQQKNAEAMQRAGAARLVPDREFDGKRLFDEVRALAADPEELARMSDAARRLARPGAAERAADILESLAR